MSWNTAKERSDQSGPTVFIRLAEDGDKFVGAFVGEPHIRELVWNTKTNKYEDFTAEHAKEGKTATPRYMLNVFIPGDEAKKTPPQMKIFEANNATFKDIIKVREKYGLEKFFFEVERNGKKGDTKTSYTILPETQIDAAQLALISSMKLNDLTKSRSEDSGDTAETNMQSHDAAKNGAAAPAAGAAPADEPCVTQEESQAIIARLKVLPKEKLDSFMTKFGVKQIKLLKAKDLPLALATLDGLEGKPPAAAAAPDPVDPFA